MYYCSAIYVLPLYCTNMVQPWCYHGSALILQPSCRHATVMVLLATAEPLFGPATAAVGEVPAADQLPRIEHQLPPNEQRWLLCAASQVPQIQLKFTSVQGA